MIKRIWHGWTVPERADRYERLLGTVIVPDIASRNLEGYRRFQLLRRDAGEEVEFLTVMSFESMDGVRAFAGDDREAAFVPPEAREVLARFDERVRHYELRDDRRYATG